jgi:hypothetical protein
MNARVAALGARLGGLRPDKDAANAAVARWLREIASARVHGTTGEVPAARLKIERSQLHPLPRYGGRSVRQVHVPRVHEPIVGYQHPLSLYEELVGKRGMYNLQHDRISELCRELWLDGFV